MGKLQESSEKGGGVKREVVSASANLEVISQESFAKRLEGMSSSCANCQKERTRSSHPHHGQQPSNQHHHYRREKAGHGGSGGANNGSRKGKPNRRRQQQQLSKSNTPIVIHLKDTLRSSLAANKRQSSLDGDSDVSTRSTDEEQCSTVSTTHSSNSHHPRRRPNHHHHHHHHHGHHQTSASSAPHHDHHPQFSIYGDVASIPEFVPQYSSPVSGHHFHQAAWAQSLYHHHHHHHMSPFSGPGFYSPHQMVPHRSPYHQFHSTRQRAKDKTRNSLTALISVIEKSNQKDATKDMELNLSKNSMDAKLLNVLNNNNTNNAITDSVVTGDSKGLKRLNMDCENVELICNDLSTDKQQVAESTDGESDTSDKVSVASSSDTLSDDVADSPVLHEEVKGHEFTPDELEQLAEYTTGAPLIRYDWSPPSSQCSECINTWYSYQYFQYDGCDMYTSTSQYPFRRQQHPSQHHHHHQPQRKSHHQHLQYEKAAVSPRTSLSSDSDLSSDVDEGSTSSSLSSKSSSSLSSSSSSSSTHKAVTASVKTGVKNSPPSSRQPSLVHQHYQHPYLPHSLCNRHRQLAQQAGPWRRASAPRQLWDIDVSPRKRRQEDAFLDCVYMDLTGLDVSYTVVYHSEPSPPHSGHPYYGPNITTPSPSAFNWPFKFNNSMVYPQKMDTLSAQELKKYELTLPSNRPWINTGSPDPDVPAAVFTVMCYNVLCDKLCTKAMYAYCPTWALNWDYRKKGIMSDILRGNGDIITLQEVETEQYYSMFMPELAQQGYDGIFLPKSRVRTMNSDKEKMSVDGCAIFYKKNKFEKVNEHQIEFSQLATKEGASNTDTDMINRVSTKDNIAIVAVLRTKPACYDNSPVPAKGLSQMLMVSTAHIHWDPQLPDVKLVQSMMLIEELQKFVKEASMQFRPNAPPPPSQDAADLCASMPLILCGDFNSLPDSGVYEYLSKGRLDTSHRDFEGQNYQVFMKDRHDNGIINHNFKISSAYKDVIPFTNYTFDFKGIIDYVFYSYQHLRLHGVMGLQDEEWFRANKIVGCPHPFVPSDHFPLFCEFSLPAQRPR